VAARSRNKCGLTACPRPSRVRATMRMQIALTFVQKVVICVAATSLRGLLWFLCAVLSHSNYASRGSSYQNAELPPGFPGRYRSRRLYRSIDAQHAASELVRSGIGIEKPLGGEKMGMNPQSGVGAHGSGDLRPEKRLILCAPRQFRGTGPYACPMSDGPKPRM